MAVSDDERHGDDGWGEGHDQGHLPAEGTAGDAAPAEEPARLDLADEERLPWLESVDDDDDYAGSDTGRIVAFLIAGLIVLAALVGGIWWATHRTSAKNLQADGSVVPAPAGPYKQAPADPGGKTFAGTGDTSYAVSEGQTRAPRLATDEPAPEPLATPEPAASGKAATPAPKPAPSAAPAVPTGPGVQVGAYTSKTTAEAGWSGLAQRHPELFKGLKHRVVEGRADIGTVYRLQAIVGSKGEGTALCSRFKAAGVACQFKE